MVPKISIIMPVFNRAVSVARALDSLLAQSYQQFEVVIVDDGSTDNSVEIILPYLTDPRFRLVKLEHNSGVNHARNRGLSSIHLDSAWVTFLDSDDEFVTDALENIISVISEHPNLHDYCFSVRYIDGRSASELAAAYKIFHYQDLFDVAVKPKGEWVHVIDARLIRNRTFHYEESVRNGFEAIAYLRLAKDYAVLYSSKIVRLYHVDVEGLTRIKNKTSAKSRDEILGYSVYLKEFGDMLYLHNKIEYALVHAVLGKTFLEVDDFKQCLQSTYRALLCNPLEPRVYRNILLMLKYTCFSLFNLRTSSSK
jgi:glycosyltransferase involved in cell wall biosynthesis